MGIATDTLTTPAVKGDAAPRRLQITAPRMETIGLVIRGIAPYISNRFGPLSRGALEHAQRAGGTRQSKRKRDPKDFEAHYRDSLHRSEEGWYGINASAFRQAAISACRLVGFKMTYAKLAIFIEPDGIADDGVTQLVRLMGEPELFVAPVRNESGTADLRARGMFREWSARVRVRYDTEVFTREDVVNLFARVGLQVGVGAGRPDGRESAGQGWGLFVIERVEVES
jgi:hypothetical protein